jgi:hypothetical protein
MLTYHRDAKHDDPRWVFWWKILEIASLIVLLVFAFTHGSLIDRMEREYPTMAVLTAWAAGMLSYHQDTKFQNGSWAFLSQILAVASLIALVVFGFTHRLWPNFLIAPPLLWLHIQFTKRWWVRPGAWW